MTTQGSALPAAKSAESARPARLWPAVERLMQWAGDRLNPILVKETRQALKSRQFTITFTLLLILGWGWSILGVALIGPDIYFTSQGPDMFAGYYLFLAAAMFVIVPFGAFRSLAAEQEDRTYELLSITTLGPRQIVRGKLGSAVLQMLIYLSAISPCLAFTYLLRGIDFPTIAFILFYTLLTSLGLAVVGLLLATITSERHWQVVLSVLMVAGLIGAAIATFACTMALLSEGYIPVNEPEFWQFCAGLLTAYVSYFVLVFYAAAAQITFASDNRSTRLRITMVIQHALLMGWMAWVWFFPARGEHEVLIVFMIFLGLHWYAMGALMTGESPELSPRVQRSLPQSFLGRLFLTWFNPGPGTGYLLAISSLLGALAMIVSVVQAISWGLLPGPPSLSPSEAETVCVFGIVGVSYLAIYLGIGLLVLRLLRRFGYGGILLSVLVHVILLILGFFGSKIIEWLSLDLRGADYTFLHVLNPLATLYYLCLRNTLPPEAYVLLHVVPAIALVVLLLHLPGVAREVRRVRIAPPKRVVEEDAEQMAIAHPPQPVRTSPWD